MYSCLSYIITRHGTLHVNVCIDDISKNEIVFNKLLTLEQFRVFKELDYPIEWTNEMQMFEDWTMEVTE